MAVWSLYMLSFPSGKCYIGQTIKTVQARYTEHCKPYSKCRAVSNAIKKYGIDEVRVELITTEHTQEDADRTEKELISFFKTLSPCGYNLTSGGSIYSNDTVQSAETRRKRAQSITGRVLSEKSRKQIAQSLTGKRFPHRSYPVLRIDENGCAVRFESVSEAIDNTPGSRQSGISDCVRGKLHKHCMYADKQYYIWKKLFNSPHQEQSHVGAATELLQ